ncbi:ribonuclease III [Microbacterium sp.]|uniref:ribonuclease III n=1 Tax=Microbacterium sp. TaxID=51671 RepID=UPI003A8B720D
MTEVLPGVPGLLTKLEIGIDPELLTLALTHRSYAYENGGIAHNERLEFLGDSILGQAITVHLYTCFPELEEGALAKRRASVVSTVALAEVARAIGLGEHLLLGRGEDLTGGRDKDSILADTMEAILGAAYLSAGSEAATDLVLRLMAPLLEDPERFGAAMDPKTSLQELVAGRGLEPPRYVVEASGPDHDRVFTAVVTAGSVSCTGTGTSKKQAEMAAALEVWRTLSARA